MLLIAVPLAFTICFTLLQMRFEYPDILRQPTAEILTKFRAGGPSLIATWYALAFTALLFIPIALLTHRALAERGATLALWFATTCGVLAGLVQALGFLRWPFLVPFLADAYLDPAAGESQRAAAALVFEGFHRYAGMAVGEHLGYLATSLWTAGVAIVLWRAPQAGRWLGASGLLLAAGVAAGLLEPAGVELAGAVNAVSYLAWSVWLIALGVRFVLQGREPAVGPRPAALPVPTA